MSITALQLGSELVRRAAKRDFKLTNLSLQKLAYFAHGWHLALFDKPLLEENDAFEAWRYGPVLPELYHALKAFSNNNIPADHPLIASQEELDSTRVEAKLIEKILDEYGNLTSYQLVRLSHDPDGPWAQVYSDPGFSTSIEDDSIGRFFKKDLTN